MVPVIAHPKQARDHVGDPLRRPQVRAVAVGASATEQLAQQPGLLRHCEPPGSAGGRADRQPSLAVPPMGAHPPHHRTRCTPEPSRGGVQRQALLDQRQRPSPTRLQDLRRSGQSQGDLPEEAASYCIHCAAVNKRCADAAEVHAAARPPVLARRGITPYARPTPIEFPIPISCLCGRAARPSAIATLRRISYLHGTFLSLDPPA